ncbi:Uncharacterised protein [Pseudomonas fluorescens]|uniref:Uncharacterized protein n=1 Tax=Pseudomonas fluorescens TaxID=294 RepID=A0A379IFZ9_PSEFL|nr:hypothetical protein [Pseudomonas fluorescens]AIG01934.1 hypothetical protein HZ99_07055 [Pseudomonas fluorescens]SUD31732.1 Uncharacterised protein [Pseudomonas fluorescens]
MTGNMEQALLDVRRAYRLLAEYQQRMFELLGYIRERLGATPYHHSYANPLPQGLAGLEKRENSGLRYLPFYDLSAIWLKHQGQEAAWNNHLAGDLMFGAWVRSDTGFDKYSGTFDELSAEQTQSALVLSVVICDTPATPPCNWYSSIWCQMAYPEHGEVNHEDVKGYRCYSQAIPLEQLSDKSAVDNAIDAWCTAASDKLDWPIEPLQKQ